MLTCKKKHIIIAFVQRAFFLFVCLFFYRPIIIIIVRIFVCENMHFYHTTQPFTLKQRRRRRRLRQRFNQPLCFQFVF